MRASGKEEFHRLFSSLKKMRTPLPAARILDRQDAKVARLSLSKDLTDLVV